MKAMDQQLRYGVRQHGSYGSTTWMWDASAWKLWIDNLDKMYQHDSYKLITWMWDVLA